MVQFIIITPTINIITKYIHGPVKYIYGVLSGFIIPDPNACGSIYCSICVSKSIRYFISYKLLMIYTLRYKLIWLVSVYGAIQTQ
eukprot:UN09367